MPKGPESLGSTDELQQGAGNLVHEEDSTEESREEDVAADDEENNSDESNDNEDLLNKDDNPVGLPNIGARIRFRDPETNIIQKATITKMHRTMQYQWPGWRNVLVDGDRKQSSINLDIVSHLCVMWEHLDDIPPVPRAPGDGYIPQIDGNYTLPSGPSYKDYGEAFTDNEIEGDIFHIHDDRTRVYFVPPSLPSQPTQASQPATSGWRSRWKLWTDRFFRSPR